jgi:ubiquinone/menaquinone biosynthesis C-methylase UbiE
MSELNSVELAAMSSGWRRFSQQSIELPILRRLLRRAGVDLRGRRLLDAGCGAGWGLEALREQFQPSRLVGFDLMTEQVKRASTRLGESAEIRTGDITQIAEPDGSFDGVFVFGILHHVPAWRAALREIARVLVPGGVLAIEELSGSFARFEDIVFRTHHPAEAAFDFGELRDAIEASGLVVVAEQMLLPGAARAMVAKKG